MFESVNITAPFLSVTNGLPPSPSSHHEVSAWRAQVFEDGLRHGKHGPMVLNMFFESSSILLLYFLVPALKGPLARYGTFGLNTAFQLYLIQSCRSANPTVGFLVGFLCAWNILWSAVLLVFNDSKKRSRKVQRSGSSFVWQSPPTNFAERIGWASDLVFNSRGIGWDWKVSGTPSRPPAVEAALRKIDLQEAIKEDKPVSTSRARFESRSTALGHYAAKVILGYLLMDVLKIFVNRDPYFWGYPSAAPPAIFSDVPMLAALYRSAVALAFIWLALTTSFALVPVIFLSLSSGTNAEAWMYPSQFGSYSTVFSRGIAGFWGGWWHQLFRYGFQSAGRWLTKDVLHMKPKSQLGGVVELLVSFYLSGFMHMAASITMIGDTSPWMKMFFFFALQPAGIILELVASHFLYLGLRKSVPKPVLKYSGMAAHFIFAHAWLYLTLPYLVEDLARGGLFLAEPSPVSPMRALGFGVPGDTAFPWHDAGTFWYRAGGSKWWLSGLAL